MEVKSSLPNLQPRCPEISTINSNSCVLLEISERLEKKSFSSVPQFLPFFLVIFLFPEVTVLYTTTKVFTRPVP